MTFAASNYRFLRALSCAALAVPLFASCGGGSGGAAAGTSASTAVTASVSADNSTATTATSPTSGASTAARLAARIGKPARLLVGLGTGSSPASIQAQALKPDIYDQYLVGVGAGAWPDWNSPAGAYVNVVADQADRMGAVPMYTLYQMASNGDGNLSGLGDPQFMKSYWANVRLLFQRLAIYGKPALVNLEPDFWGYAQLQSPNGDPTALAAAVSIDPDCANQPDNAVGVAGCLLQMARKYAPNALVGFPTSDWGSGSVASVANFMQRIGAGRADFTVLNTLDRDAGCFEAAAPNCTRAGSGWYWDESNVTHPNFHDHLADAQTYANAIGLPLVWWQTPMGVPSATPGGTTGHWRDDREHYFLTHPSELTAVGGLAVVFSAGADGQTTIDTDGGQFQRLSGAYFANPAPLP